MITAPGACASVSVVTSVTALQHLDLTLVHTAADFASIQSTLLSVKELWRGPATATLLGMYSPALSTVARCQPMSFV